MKPNLPLTLEEIAALETPADNLVSNPAYSKRKGALTLVLTGIPLARAAATCGVNRNTLSTVLRNALSMHVDGNLNGFRACLPFFRCVDVAQKVAPVELPTEPRAHAYTKLVASVSTVGALIQKFSGALPDKNCKSPAFNRLFTSIKKALRKAGLEGKYPLSNPDEGRRALLIFLRRARLALKELNLHSGALDECSSTRIPALFSVNPFDCVQFDAHFTDVKWTALIPTPDGGTVRRAVSGVWLLSVIDVASLAIIAWILVVGRNYNEYDARRLLAKCLMPWRRRDLTIPGLEYRADAWMPTAVEHASMIPRAIEVSADNHKAHLAKSVLLALADLTMGVYALGPPYVPEIRSEIEHFHKSFEEHFIRLFAGGYWPTTELGETGQKTTRLNPNDYPFECEALEEVTDVYMSGYNVTEIRGRQMRSPRDICETFRAGGGWYFTSSLTAKHAADISIVRKKITIRGNKGSRSEQKQPHVNYEGAKYHSSALHGRFDLVGKQFWAEHSLEDARTLTLRKLDEGTVYVVLHVQAPWKHSAHSIDLRKKINAWSRQGRIQRTDNEDIVTAYHLYVRANAHRIQVVADQFAKLPKDVRDPSWSPPSLSKTTDNQPVFLPRGGPIQLGRRTRS